jgi:hypothetical protein
MMGIEQSITRATNFNMHPSLPAESQLFCARARKSCFLTVIVGDWAASLHLVSLRPRDAGARGL